jgi:hypothetical protein
MALNDEEQKVLEDQLKKSQGETATANSEKDAITLKHDKILDEKKKFKYTVKKLVGEDTEELSETQIVERLEAVKAEAKKAVKSGETSSEEYAALLAKQTVLEGKITTMETSGVKTKAAEAFALKSAELTKALALKDVTGEQLEDALEIALPKLNGKDDINYGEFAEEFLKTRPHLVSSGFVKKGVESKVDKQVAKDAKEQAAAIQAKLKSGQHVTPAEMKKLENTY